MLTLRKFKQKCLHSDLGTQFLSLKLIKVACSIRFLSLFKTDFKEKSFCLQIIVFFTLSGLVFSWGDGDFGKLGRGGSEGCNIPQNIERLNGQGVCQIECGAQFSLALTKSGGVWTW